MLLFPLIYVMCDDYSNCVFRVKQNLFLFKTVIVKNVPCSMIPLRLYPTTDDSTKA